MKLTAIKKQLSNDHRFSIYVDNKYAFSLGEAEILRLKLKLGQEINNVELNNLKQLSSEDKLYAQALKLVVARAKSEWEVSSYLERKGASPTLTNSILNKLRDIDLVNDFKFAEMYIRDLKLHSPASRRKIISKLKQKRVKQEAIEAAIDNLEGNDESALAKLIESKSAKYKDPVKLMAYLSRQGFSYSDIKDAINNQKDIREY